MRLAVKTIAATVFSLASRVLPAHLAAGNFGRRLRASVRLPESLRKLIFAAEQVHLAPLLSVLKSNRAF